MRLDRRFALIAIALLAAAAPARGIEIQSDTAELDRNAGRSIYRGDVVLTREGLELRGDKLVVTRDADDRFTAVLTGNPARLHQAPANPDEAPVNGSAARMTYRSGSELVELRGEAMIERGGNAVRSDTITHDLASGRTKARRADGEDGERVRITLEPPPDAEPPPDQSPSGEETPDGNAGAADDG
ncbi:lipopolysaccharide export system protein LptA [Salinisphaera sp. PC39]|uniref:lipopolysaccharide transport periplasmic protein LptA n=1 Tax=Salinisphaera sp. PC39 TaxID=1304156 RepID=UPI00333F4CEF